MNPSGEREQRAQMLTVLMDQLPIFATQVGYHVDSTDEQRLLGDAIFAVHEKWLEVKPC